MGRGIQGCIKLLPEQSRRTLTSISESIPVSSTVPKPLLSHSGCSEMACHRPETPSNGLELSSFEGQRIMNPTVLQDSGAFRSPNSSVIGHYGPPQEPWYEQFGYTSYPIGVCPIPRIVWASVDRMGSWEMNNFADVLNAEEYGRPTNYLSGSVGWEWDGRDDQSPGKDYDCPYI